MEPGSLQVPEHPYYSRFISGFKKIKADSKNDRANTALNSQGARCPPWLTPTAKGGFRLLCMVVEQNTKGF